MEEKDINQITTKRTNKQTPKQTKEQTNQKQIPSYKEQIGGYLRESGLGGGQNW